MSTINCQPTKKKLNLNLINTKKSSRLERKEPLSLYCKKGNLWSICENSEPLNFYCEKVNLC